MDQKVLEFLIDKFNDSDAVELKFSTKGSRLSIKKKEAFLGNGLMLANEVQPKNFGSYEQCGEKNVDKTVYSKDSNNENNVVPSKELEDKKTSSDCFIIKSPIVGTFYRAASPDAPPFVEVGSKVKKGQKLCILEAMKMMNSLEAEFDCVIEKILVNNEDLIEFDQALFEVKKA